jgi:hypothetical protein
MLGRCLTKAGTDTSRETTLVRIWMRTVDHPKAHGTDRSCPGHNQYWDKKRRQVVISPCGCESGHICMPITNCNGDGMEGYVRTWLQEFAMSRHCNLCILCCAVTCVLLFTCMQTYEPLSNSLIVLSKLSGSDTLLCPDRLILWLICNQPPAQAQEYVE